MKKNDQYHKWVEWSAEDGVYVGRDFLGERQVQRVAHAGHDHPERALQIARQRRAPY